MGNKTPGGVNVGCIGDEWVHIVTLVIRGK